MLTRGVVLASFAGHVIVLTVVCVAQLLAQGPLPHPHRLGDRTVVRLARLADIELPPMPRTEAPPTAARAAASSSAPLPSAPSPAAPVEPPIGIRPERDLDRALGTLPFGRSVPERSLAEVSGALPDAVPPPQLPTADSAPPVRLREGVAPPTPLFTPAPAYPSIARSARVAGVVILDVVIDDAGRVTDVKVLRSIPALDQAAVDAISAWRYEPARLNGRPIAIAMTVTIRFMLN